MPVRSPARCLLLAVACVSALEAGCTTEGQMIGMAPNGTASAPSGNNASSSSANASVADAVSSGDFKPLINRSGVAGCMTITEDQVPTNYFETVGLGTAAGAVLLALLGAAAGAVLSGGDGGAAAQGAIIGGVAGAGLGAASGVQTAEQKQAYAVQLARYDCQIQAAEMENGSLSSSSARLQASVDDLTKQLDQLEDDYANKRMNRAQALKELNDIDDSSASLQHRLVAMRENTDQFQQYAASTQQMAQGTQRAIDQARISSLDQKIAEMKTRNEQVAEKLEQLSDRRKALQL